MNFLYDARTRLGFAEREMADKLDLSPQDYRALERMPYDDIDTSVLMDVRDLLGLDLDALLEERFPERYPVATLLKGATNTLPAATRFAIAAATSVGRDYTSLRERLDPEQPGTAWRWLQKTRADNDYGHPRDGHAEKLAQRARRRLGLNLEQPIRSMRDLLIDKGILLLEDRVPSGLDACSMGNGSVAPLILTNMQSVRMRAGSGRRVAWAHELVHLLYDRPMMLDVKRLCVVAPGPGYARGEWGSLERRARAFAVYFLAPRAPVQALWSSSKAPPHERVRAVMQKFGLGYEATRGHLDNLGLLSIKENIPRVDFAGPEWDEAEHLPAPDEPGASELPPLERLHRLGTPLIRGGLFARRVLETFLRHRDAITPGQVADLLRVPNGLFQQEYLGDMREHVARSSMSAGL